MVSPAASYNTNRSGGAMEKQIWQAGVRYERPGAIATRLDAGYMVSPIGLGLLDNRSKYQPDNPPASHLPRADAAVRSDRAA